MRLTRDVLKAREDSQETGLLLSTADRGEGKAYQTVQGGSPGFLLGIQVSSLHLMDVRHAVQADGPTVAAFKVKDSDAGGTLSCAFVSWNVSV